MRKTTLRLVVRLMPSITLLSAHPDGLVSAISSTASPKKCMQHSSANQSQTRLANLHPPRKIAPQRMRLASSYNL
eukprot:5745941-Amphidinium_carterae.1